MICYHSLDEATELCKLATVVITNKNVSTVAGKSVQELEKTINCFDMLPQIEKNAGCCATDKYDQEVIIEPASTRKELWDKELANYVAKKGCKKVQRKDKQNKYFMYSYYHQ